MEVSSPPQTSSKPTAAEEVSKSPQKPDDKEASPPAEKSPSQSAAMEEATYVRSSGRRPHLQQKRASLRRQPQSLQPSRKLRSQLRSQRTRRCHLLQSEKTQTSLSSPLQPRVLLKKDRPEDRGKERFGARSPREKGDQRGGRAARAHLHCSCCRSHLILWSIFDDYERSHHPNSRADKPAVTSDAAWQEADFSFEDAPAPSKESLTSGMGRKNLIAMADNPDDADSEMQDMDAPQQQRSEHPLKSPRSSSAGPKAKAAPAEKSANKIPRAASPQGKAVGKPAAKPPPKAITPLDKAAAPKGPPPAVTAKQV